MISRRAWLGAAAATSGALMLPRTLWAQAARTAGENAAPSAYPHVRDFIASFVQRRQLAGTLAMIGKGQAPATIMAAGHIAMDSSTKVDANSLWRLYSNTKPITAMAMMILIDDGVVRLDQPIADFLPAFAKMKVQNTPDGSISDVRDAKQPITIRHLLTHTAGFGYAIMQKGPLRQAYEEAGLTGGVFTKLPVPGMTGQIAPSLAEFADRLAALPLVYEPDTQWSYSVSLDLAGRVIEVASGQSFDEFLRQRIFTPLDMSSTWFQVPSSEVGRFTTNYSPLGGILFPIDPARASIYLDKPKTLHGGSGLVSSARDYDRFLAMLMGEGALGNTRILRPETARLAMSNLIGDHVARKGTFIDGAGFGAGGRVSLAHTLGGEGIYGWSGAAGTLGFVDRKRGYRVAAYAQYLPPNSLDFQSKFPEIVMQDIK